MERKHHEFIDCLPVELVKFGGVSVTIRVTIEDVNMSIVITDEKTSIALNEFILKARKIKEALE